jgi:hypothetical protein
MDFGQKVIFFARLPEPQLAPRGPLMKRNSPLNIQQGVFEIRKFTRRAVLCNRKESKVSSVFV